MSFRAIGAYLQVVDFGAGRSLNPREFGSQAGQQHAGLYDQNTDMTVGGVPVQLLRELRCRN